MKVGTSIEHIEAVVAIPDRVQRNYWVTQTYHDLSNGLRELLEPNTSNWCTFAVWASSTIGGNLRGEALPRWLQERVVLPDGIMGAVATTKAHGAWPSVSGLLHELTPEHLLVVTRELLGEMATELSEGNTEVFAEIAPPAGQFLLAYGGDHVDAAKARASVLAACDHAKEYEGVNHLRAGYSTWCDALETTDATERSQKILAGSLHLGVHEQNHLQPVIASSMDMGANELGARLKSKLVRDERDARDAVVLIDDVLRPVVKGIGDLWDTMMTETFGKMTSPEGTFRLDRDIPGIDGRSFIPTDLSDFVTTELETLWRRFNRAKKSGKGSFATNWVDFKDRMNFITNLFISRHHEARLFEAPLSATALADLSAGRTPPSKEG